MLLLTLKAMSLFVKRFGLSLIALSIFSVSTASATLVTDFRINVLSDKESYDIDENVVVTLQAENFTSNDVSLNFFTGCQIEIEVFMDDELVYSENDYPRNCSEAATTVSIPDGKKAVWTRTFNSSEEGYPFVENGRYTIHGFIKDHEDTSWYSQATSYVTVVFGEEFLYVFNDIFDHWANVYIEKLANRGVVDGFEDGGFHPDDPINRAEMVKLALAGAGIENSDNLDGLTFTDLDEWQKPFILEAFNRGIIQGYSETEFAPSQIVTRAEAVKIALFAFGADLPETSDQWSFEDTKDHWANSYINYAFSYFIVAGREDGYFYPNDQITRAEAAKIISKLIEM